MKRYLILAAAITMHFCLGGVYAWSAFVPALQREFGYTAAQTQLVFGVTVAVLCLGGIVAGRMQDLLGPRIPACIGGVLLGAGYMLAGVKGDSYAFLLLGIGVLCAVGVSFGYISAMATVAKWFPKRRGLATGLVVAGYGAAAIGLSAIAEVMFARGWPVLRIFRAVGVVYGPMVVAAGLILAVPRGSLVPHAVTAVRRRHLFRDPRYWALAIGIGAGTYPGLALIGALKPIGLWHGHELMVATASISALAVGNSAGRITWGALHDHHPGGHIVKWLMLSVMLSVVLFAAGGLHPALFVGASLLLGFCYGGVLSVFPCEVASRYGVQVMGSVYPIVLQAHGLAGLVAAPLTGLGVDLTGGYWPGIALAFAVSVAGLLASIVLDRPSPTS